MVTELAHPPEVQALGKSSRYTDIVLIDLTLFLLRLFRSMQNISKWPLSKQLSYVHGTLVKVGLAR